MLLISAFVKRWSLKENIMDLNILTFGNPEADTYLIQMVDDHDLEFLESQLTHIRELTGGQDFCMKAVQVKSWNRALSPWQAPAVFGNEDFGDGAGETLHFLEKEILADLSCGPVVPAEFAESAGTAGFSEAEKSVKKIFLGGYSLAGLFALWAAYQTDRFDGIAAASPSIWFPDFIDHMRNNRIQTKAVYLSLGDREERTRNPVMSKVGTAILDAESILAGTETDCILEWNKGNHFKQPDLRTAKAFAWLMNRRKN